MSPITPSLSPQGLDFIKRTQGLALAPYRDESGLRVIGYGHVLNDYETFNHSRARSRRPCLPSTWCNASASLSATCG